MKFSKFYKFLSIFLGCMKGNFLAIFLVFWCGVWVGEGELRCRKFEGPMALGNYVKKD
jgi:hypothetical protein